MTTIINDFKLAIKVLRQKYRDRRSGLLGKMSQKKMSPSTLPIQLELTQEIKKSAFFENKRHNIGLAAQKIEGILLEKDAVLSFWHLVGKPNARNGFRIGRTLKNGVLSPDFGGGICQTACILHHLALIADLEILERHNHSVDIYEENERFTPLGADATVVYANKDLRIRNPFPYAIVLSFVLEAQKITCRLHSNMLFEKQNIDFRREYKDNFVIVTTLKNNVKKIATSIYRIKKSETAVASSD